MASPPLPPPSNIGGHLGVDNAKSMREDAPISLYAPHTSTLEEPEPTGWELPVFLCDSVAN